MSKFRVVVDAVQWDGTRKTAPAILELSNCQVAVSLYEGRPVFEIETSGDVKRGEVGDWLIKGANGEFYPCKPDIFAATYEAVSDEPAD